MSISIKPDLTPRFDEDGCLDVPTISSGINHKLSNEELLRDYRQLLMTAQNSLDRIPTYKYPNLSDKTSMSEKSLIESLTELNAEIVLRVLVMRRLITDALVKGD